MVLFLVLGLWVLSCNMVLLFFMKFVFGLLFSVVLLVS